MRGRTIVGIIVVIALLATAAGIFYQLGYDKGEKDMVKIAYSCISGDNQSCELLKSAREKIEKKEEADAAKEYNKEVEKTSTAIAKDLLQTPAP